MFRFRRARRQGMTEYIIIVGLIAILLVAAVRRFSTVLDVTIQGSTGQVNGISNRIRAGSGSGTGTGTGTYVSALPSDAVVTGTTASSASTGKNYIHDGTGWIEQ